MELLIFLFKKFIKRAGYTCIPVVEQCSPDPDFSNTPTPNPEQAGAYELSLKYAKENQADLILVCDPDADRMGVGVLHNGEYVVLTGNQSGSVEIEYICSQLKKQGKMPENPVMFNTVVTSDLGEKVASDYGVTTEKTLTGFKFIGEKVAKYEKTHEKNYVFGYEESYGSLIKPFVRDKDAPQACLMLAEACAFYKEQGKDLVDVLDSLYDRHGTYEESQVALSLAGEAGAKRIKEILANLRKDAPTQIGGTRVVRSEDYKECVIKEGDKVTELAGFTKSDVLKYYLEDGSWIADFDPYYPYYQYMYREANAWNALFFAPHDPEGVIKLYPNNKAVENKLDSLFTEPWHGYEVDNMTGFIGNYCHGNQPGHSIPYTYYFIGKQEKSQAVLDSLMGHYYDMGKDKLAYAGMDDAGEMSSWYVFNAIGLYTYSPADPEYIVTVPLFDKVTFLFKDKPFTIVKQGHGRKIRQITYDNEVVDGLHGAEQGLLTLFDSIDKSLCRIHFLFQEHQCILRLLALVCFVARMFVQHFRKLPAQAKLRYVPVVERQGYGTSSSVSTIKSGMICWRFLPIVSPRELPGRGFSLVSSAVAALYCSSVIPSFWMILSLFFW